MEKLVKTTLIVGELGSRLYKLLKDSCFMSTVLPSGAKKVRISISDGLGRFITFCPDMNNYLPPNKIEIELTYEE